MMHHSNPYGYSSKRRGPLNLPDDVVSFRLVCPTPVVGGLIGRSGSIISSIRRDTKCRIHCEGGFPGSDHRVIFVVGSGSIDRRIMFCENDVVVEGGEVSSTQEAVIRVFERMWEVEAEVEGDGDGDDVAYCGLLANTTKIGVVVGKGGRNVTRMRIESGAKIVMLPPPACAAIDDQLIQITGATLAVKKALVAVTTCLQHLSTMEKSPICFNRPIEKVFYSNSSDPHREFFPHLSLVPPLTGNPSDNASEFHSSSADADRDHPGLDKKGRKQEVALRMLFSGWTASGIIGKRGAIVRSLQNASGALISFAAPLTKSGERVVTISALEYLDTRHSPVQNAAVLVFARSVEVEGQQGFSSGENKGDAVAVSILVGADFVGCLTGSGSSAVSEMEDVTGTDIKLVGGEQVLGCAAQNDVVIQISGEYKNVQNALSEVVGRLRHNLKSGEILNEARPRSPSGRVGGPALHKLHQSVALSPEFEQETIAVQGVDQFVLPLNRSQTLQTEGRRHATPTTDGKPGSRMFEGSLELEKSLVHLLPTDMVDEVGPRSCSDGMTTASGEDNMLTEGVSQLGLSDNIIGPSTLQLPKTGEEDIEYLIQKVKKAQPHLLIM
ncbi:RNA-binding KH domain-containing protein [Citrus sinensis]|uniref:RNA-binding KH domain-containing protein RCF3 isoform X3 n=1 Tax=Citrus clementina TaxID=85681 RepID=UPI000CED0810|nr:RNA-binding KH domain-containing protein RCF3 isoform X3 [Citrus x clementina]XP_024037167.1 RNA-binding KH domain-containing protein RCF3 isoform X3 [Citrus x clementina]KAH9664319.1 RNA-binding KH domain-containing protein [Citrus sinensis]